MTSVSVMMSLPHIKGYEYTGEYRTPSHGELFHVHSTRVDLCRVHDYAAPHFIMREIAYREPGSHYWYLDAGFEVCKALDTASATTITRFDGRNYFNKEFQARALRDYIKEFGNARK